MRGPLHNTVSPSRNTFRPTGCPCDVAGCRSAATSRSRDGFTLVEMLITITIIGILAAGVTAAVQSAREAAKASATKATITKLHYIIMARYDSYRTRRVPIDVPTGTYPQVSAFIRLCALRDLMRMEMPDRWSDLLTDPIPLVLHTPPFPAIGPFGSIDRPAITQRYIRLYDDAYNALQDRVTAGEITAAQASDMLDNNAPAECLYMIVMSIPEAAEQFQATEIGDVDDDGLKEFVDGWGHAISFIRWPAGFVDRSSLLALNPSGGGTPKGPAGQQGGDPLEWDPPSDLQTGDREAEPDPFDSMHVGGGFTVRLLAPPLGAGYSLFPLIYSAGPDGIFDINIYGPGIGTISDPYRPLLDPYRPLERSVADSDGNTLVYLGQPLDGDAIDGTPKNDELNHYDNIHNHRLEVR